MQHVSSGISSEVFRWRGGCAAIASCLIIAGVTSAAAESSPRVVAGEGGLLKYSDVLLSPRGYRADWREAIKAYRATRIVWTYAGERYIKEGAEVPVQCSFPFFVPQTDPNASSMSCVTPAGQSATRTISGESSGSTKAAAEKTFTYPDVTRPAWRQYVEREMHRMIDAGCRSFQQDDPWQNVSRERDGGCHSPDSPRRPRVWLQQKQAKAGPDAAQDQADVRAYYEWLHGEVRKYAAEKHPQAKVTFSGNITNYQLDKSGWVIPEFDFLVSEMYGSRLLMPKNLRAFAAATRSLKGPSAVTIATSDVGINRRGIAMSYALGIVPVAPYDVYTGGNKPRYFADPEAFRDMFSLVRDHASLFDDHRHVLEAFNDYTSIVPFDGLVTAVDVMPNRIEVQWSGGQGQRDLPKNTALRIGGTAYHTIADTKAGRLHLPRSASVRVGDPVAVGRSDVLVSERQAGHGGRKVLHLVNWRDRRPMWVGVPAREGSARPTLYIPGKASRQLTPERRGDLWLYDLGVVDEWAILAD